METAEPPPLYTFTDTNVTLSEFYKMSRGSVEINIKECMTYLTAKTDLNAISNDKFVREHWGLIQKLALANDIMILFEK